MIENTRLSFMAKKSKKRKKHKRNAPGRANIPPGILDIIYPTGFTWMDEEGLHALIPGEPPPEEFFQLWSENFQKELRNSPLWDEMMAKFGQEEAEKLLKQCQMKLRKS
jgi:hypothetical protein